MFPQIILPVFSRRFRIPICVPRIRENYHLVPKIRENRLPRIREIVSLQIHTGKQIFPLIKKKRFYTEQIFLSVSVIVLVEFSMNFKLSEICNNIQSYQNTNKIHNSFKQPIVFGAVCIAFECCKCARMRFHCATVLVILSICAPWREHCWRCNANGHSHNALSFLHYKKMPHVTVTITKNASLAATVRYINITTIYTVGYLQIFNSGHFYSSKHCHYQWRKKHWITVVFNETINCNFILLSKQGRTQLMYSTQLTTEHVFENFGGNCPVALPLIPGSACKTCQHHFTVVLKLSWAAAPFKGLSTLVAPCSSIKKPSTGLCLYSWPPEKFDTQAHWSHAH